MPDWLYDTGNGWVFLLVTVIIGGSAAFLSGRAIAQTWRPYWHIPLYMVPIAASVRFFHYALFHEPMLSLQNYIVDFAVVLAAASLGYRHPARPPDGAAVPLAVPPLRGCCAGARCLETSSREGLTTYRRNGVGRIAERIVPFRRRLLRPIPMHPTLSARSRSGR